ncbi:MAG: hypothetical protein V9E91_04105 [Burkholderiaceae bacterium]|jgi:hypothetical protein
MNNSYRLFTVILFSAIPLFGCTVLDPHQVGQGNYYQVKNSSGTVILENDSAGNGYINCPNRATQDINSNPALKGRINCATSASKDSLPYRISITQSKSTQASNVGTYKPTSAFQLRFASQAVCLKELTSAKSDSKWAIVEENCSGMTTTADVNKQSTKPIAPATNNARFLQTRRIGSSIETPLVQIATQNSVQCQAAIQRVEQFLKANGNQAGEAVSCVNNDANFKFSMSMKNELDGDFMVITTKTMPLCLGLFAALKDTLIPKINLKQYSVVYECKAL